MAKWVPCGNEFIPADVVRWKEGVWEKRSRRRNARPMNMGDRLVTAEFIREDEAGWVFLLVRRCSVVSERTGYSVPLLPLGQEVRRKRSTLSRGKPERLLWSDESARSAVAGSCKAVRDRARKTGAIPGKRQLT